MSKTDSQSLKSGEPLSEKEAAGIRSEVTTLSGNEPQKAFSSSDRDTGKWKEQVIPGDVKEKEDAINKAKLEKQKLEGYKGTERFPLEPKFVRLGRDESGRRK